MSPITHAAADPYDNSFAIMPELYKAIVMDIQLYYHYCPNTLHLYLLAEFIFYNNISCGYIRSHSTSAANSTECYIKAWESLSGVFSEICMYI